MDTNKLKKFAPAARAKLMNAVDVKLDYVLTAKTPDLAAAEKLLSKLRKAIDREGREQVVERVAYTWFNRLAALRYLDARGWHPFRLRVLTSAGEDAVQPELLQQVRQGVIPEDLQEFISAERINDLLDGKLPSDNPQAEVQRLLVLAACRFYHDLLPNLFEKIDDETELLLPDDLLTEHSIAYGFRTEITDEDCAEVEVLGWLYQFYISDKKDAVMARKKAVPSEDIPAVTQLFTPHWIVRYLVENSLGRLWLRSRPHSRLREHMPYYVEDSAPMPPAWQERWREQGLEARDGDYRSLMWLRPNPDLKDDYYENWGYALTIDGYAYAQDTWRIDATAGDDVRKFEELEAQGWDGLCFEDLRFCLFMVQRGIKWTDDRDGSLTEIYHAIYDAICKAWDREWQKHQAELPDLSRYGIRVQEAASPLTVEKPEDIKLLDPACGSGHMLTYAFDLLVKIYEEEGHAPSEIPEKILTHNLFGLEICPRAAQLAQFALVCKAREQSRAAFRRPVQPQVMCLRDVVLTPDEMQTWSAATGVKLSQDELTQIHQFRENAETFGSLIQPVLDGEKLAALMAKIGEQAPAGDLLVQNTQRKLRLVLDQAEMLSQRYQVVVANPPYMGSKQMTNLLKEFLKTNYKGSEKDMFAAAIKAAHSQTTVGGIQALVTPSTWMFISSFEDLRTFILTNTVLSNLVQLETNAFEPAMVTVCAFTLEKRQPDSGVGSFIRLSDFKGAKNQPTRTLEAINNPDCGWFYQTAVSNFSKIPGRPIAFWINEAVRDAFADNPALGSLCKPKVGLQTGDNDRWVRSWFEVPYGKMDTSSKARDEAKNSGKRWFPYNKGGGFRKWFGNCRDVVDWEGDGTRIRNFTNAAGNLKSRPQNTEFYFQEGVTWGKITSALLSVRHDTPGFIPGDGGMKIYGSSEVLRTVTSLLNSIVVRELVSCLSQTLNFEQSTISKLPIKVMEGLGSKTLRLITLARADWDNFETSWDFRDLPLLRSGNWEVEPSQTGGAWKGCTIAESWNHYASYCTAAIGRMQELETENNRLWIDAYGLQDELDPVVPEDEITLARADAKKDMAAFLSYAVGCMMGRYSLDRPGLILADAGDTLEQYFEKVGKSKDEATFLPDDDAIIPMTEDDWFEDDAASRMREFLRATFGSETLDENVAFLEESLGKDLRKYFTANTGGFYADHVKTYKKRPIYWMFESPKKHFRALVYLHRYTKDTVNLLLDGYLREFIHKLTNKISDLEAVGISEDATAKEKTTATKALKKAKDALKDVEDYERDIILPLAQQRLEIDLDDGVKTNYPKFGKALAKVSGLS